MNPRQFQMIFEPDQSEKTLQTADRHLVDFIELGEVLDEGDYMMHLRARKLQALDDCSHLIRRGLMKQHTHREIPLNARL